MTPLNQLSEVSHALARVRTRYATTPAEVAEAVAFIGLTVVTKDWGAGFDQTRYSAVVTHDGAELLTVLSADELQAAKIAAYDALVVLQREAVRAIGDEVQS